jgi:hypothetical protein
LKSKIIFLCEENELLRELKYYSVAFQELNFDVCCSGKINSLRELELDNVSLIIQPGASPILPDDIVNCPIILGCFHIDTNEGAKKRARFSSLFDLVFVFHPGFKEIFIRGGSESIVLLPHAVDKGSFIHRNVVLRQYQVGWVGRVDGENYSIRRNLLSPLQRRFTMNDPFRTYTQQELIEIYRSSKIVVNISKDDYLKDANLRCFEAMASGALLFTFLPSELTALGFQPGEHFIGFTNEPELHEKIQYYLDNPRLLTEIAEKGREMVLTNHTYENRVQTIISSTVVAKKRVLSSQQQYELMIQFFAFRRCLSSAVKIFNKIHFFSLKKVSALYYLLRIVVSNVINNLGVGGGN